MFLISYNSSQYYRGIGKERPLGKSVYDIVLEPVSVGVKVNDRGHLSGSMQSAQKGPSRLFSLKSQLNKVLCQSIAETASDVTLKKVVIKNYLKHEPQPLDQADIQKKAIQFMSDIDHEFQTEGCEVRAWEICDRIADVFGKDNCINITISSTAGIVSPKANDFFQGVPWGFHISAAVYGRDGQVYLFDPVVDSKQALSFSAWIKNFQFEQDVVIRVSEKNSSALNQNVSVQEAKRVGNDVLSSMRDRLTYYKKNLTYDQSCAYTPPACFRFRLSASGDQSFSFSKQVSESMYYAGRYFCACDLSIIKDYPINKTERPFSLFNETPNGDVKELKTREAVMKKLVALNIANIEVNKIPCNLDDKTHYRVVEH